MDTNRAENMRNSVLRRLSPWNLEGGAPATGKGGVSINAALSLLSIT